MDWIYPTESDGVSANVYKSILREYLELHPDSEVAKRMQGQLTEHGEKLTKAEVEEVYAYYMTIRRPDENTGLGL